jgi:hypothetical protein
MPMTEIELTLIYDEKSGETKVEAGETKVNEGDFVVFKVKTRSKAGVETDAKSFTLTLDPKSTPFSVDQITEKSGRQELNAPGDYKIIKCVVDGTHRGGAQLPRVGGRST